MPEIRDRIEACIRSYIDGDMEGGLVTIDQIIEACAAGDPGDQAYAYFAKGNLLIRLGRHKEALLCFRTAASLDHDNPSILFNLGMEEINTGNKHRAKEYLLRAAQLGHAKAPQALQALNADAPIAFTFGPKTDQNEVVLGHVKRGMANVAAQRYDDALIEYNRAIELAPDFGHTYTLRGVVFEKLERYQEALADHDRAIQLSANNPVAYYNRGVVHELLGHASEALRDYSRSIELDPTDADVFYNRGNVHNAAGRFQEAVADFSRAIELKPDYALAYNNRGNAWSRLMDFDAAMKDYDRALSLAPQEALFHMNKGACHYNRGETEQAVQHLAKALQLGDTRALDLLHQIAGPDVDLSFLKSPA